MDFLQKGAKKEITNGQCTLFWRDFWLNETPLLHQTTKDVPLEESFKLVKDYWTPSEGWKWEVLERYLTKSTLDLIALCLIRENEMKEGSLVWSPSFSETFTTKLAYELVLGGSECKLVRQCGGMSLGS